MVRNSLINSGDLSIEEYHELCRKAVKMNSKMSVTFSAENEVAPSKYYSLEMQSEGEIDEVEQLIVQAFKCPTTPETYLHVKSDSRGNIVWICATEIDRLSSARVPAFATKTVAEIIEGTVPNIYEIIFSRNCPCFITLFFLSLATPDEIRKHPNSRVKRSVVNTDRFDEEQRRLLCNDAAMQMMSRSVVEFLENTRSGVQKYYVVEMELEDTSSSSRPTPVRLYIQAYKCPTQPPMYLHIGDRADGVIIWIIVRESGEQLPYEEFNSYELGIVENITEGKFTGNTTRPFPLQFGVLISNAS